MLKNRGMSWLVLYSRLQSDSMHPDANPNNRILSSNNCTSTWHMTPCTQVAVLLSSLACAGLAVLLPCGVALYTTPT